MQSVAAAASRATTSSARSCRNAGPAHAVLPRPTLHVTLATVAGVAVRIHALATAPRAAARTLGAALPLRADLVEVATVVASAAMPAADRCVDAPSSTLRQSVAAVGSALSLGACFVGGADVAAGAAVGWLVKHVNTGETAPHHPRTTRCMADTPGADLVRPALDTA